MGLHEQTSPSILGMGWNFRILLCNYAKLAFLVSHKWIDFTRKFQVAATNRKYLNLITGRTWPINKTCNLHYNFSNIRFHCWYVITTSSCPPLSIYMMRLATCQHLTTSGLGIFNFDILTTYFIQLELLHLPVLSSTYCLVRLPFAISVFYLTVSDVK